MWSGGLSRGGGIRLSPPYARPLDSGGALPALPRVRNPHRRRVPAVCRCETLDLTANELAKDHARHLAGGRVTIEHERLYRFEFPERPGALSRFLDALNGGWNVSLFHYRNHGGDVGRVLAALQVPEADSDAFDTFLTELEYPYVRECGNVAYKRFLQAS